MDSALKNINDSKSRRNFIIDVAKGSLAMASAPIIGSVMDKETFRKEINERVPGINIPNKLNVVWITCDEMNTKAMSIYGNQFTQMPAAEQMAREGIVFVNPYIQMPKCVPSRCSMITGRYAHCEGHRTLTGKEHFTKNKDVKNNDFTLTEDEPNIVSLLKENGYKTCLLGKNHLVDWNLYNKWFDMTSKWDSNEWKNRGNPYTGSSSEDEIKMQYAGQIKEDYDYSRLEDSLCVKWAKEFFNENKNTAFFALIDIGLPHPPYAEYTKMPAFKIPLENIPSPAFQPLDKVPSVERCKRKSFNLEHLQDNDRKKIRRAYYTMCEFADSKVLEIINELDRLGLKENTLIIYSADHGDSNGERNCYEKWDTFFYDEITKVPLIMRMPGTIPKGKQIEKLVEYIDIVPTILDLMGIEKPVWMQGLSLCKLISDGKTNHKDAVFCEGGVEKEACLRPDKNVNTAKQKVVLDFPESMIRSKMIRTEQYKYIFRLEGDHELYDMQKDPGELNNLANMAEYRDIISGLSERMLRFAIESETNYPLIDKLIC